MVFQTHYPRDISYPPGKIQMMSFLRDDDTQKYYLIGLTQRITLKTKLWQLGLSAQ
jgi:hypothetical protein